MSLSRIAPPPPLTSPLLQHTEALRDQGVIDTPTAGDDDAGALLLVVGIACVLVLLVRAAVTCALWLRRASRALRTGASHAQSHAGGAHRPPGLASPAAVIRMQPGHPAFDRARKGGVAAATRVAHPRRD